LRAHRRARGGIGQRTPAAAGRRHRNAALGMADADMQRGVGAHGVPDDVGFGDIQRIHDGDDVSAGDVLTVTRGVGGNIQGRVAALAIGDAPMGAAEAAHLRLPRAVVAGKLMDEDHGRARAGFLIIKIHAVGGFHLGHGDACDPLQRAIIAACYIKGAAAAKPASRSAKGRPLPSGPRRLEFFRPRIRPSRMACSFRDARRSV
jgi:hypothetical protein